MDKDKKDKIRKAIKYLATPRKLLYLYGICALTWLWAGYIIFEDKYIEAKEKSRQIEREQFFRADPDVIRDTRLTQNFFDVAFEIQTDSIVKNKSEGEEALFVSVCATECRVKKGKDVCKDRCKMPLDMPELQNLCLKDLSTSSEFHKHRVYECLLKVSLDGDQPLLCTPYTWRGFKNVCTELNNT